MLLSTDIWVTALIRRAELGGAFGVVARKGDPRAGAVLVKALNRTDGTARLYAEATRLDGERVWMEPAASHHEPDLDRYIERTLRIDHEDTTIGCAPIDRDQSVPLHPHSGDNYNMNSSRSPFVGWRKRSKSTGEGTAN